MIKTIIEIQILVKNSLVQSSVIRLMNLVWDSTIFKRKYWIKSLRKIPTFCFDAKLFFNIM